MTHPLTPREKVQKAVERAVLRACNRTIGVKDVRLSSMICGEEIDAGTDAILTALASGSGDHAELARLAEAATPGPWKSIIDDTGGERSGWPLCIVPENDDDRTVVRTGGMWPYEWDAKVSQHEAVSTAAFIAAANPATVLALIAEVAALRGENDRLKLAICGGEDVPGAIAAVTVEDCERFCRENHAARGDFIDRSTEAERKLAEADRLINRAAALMRQCADPERFEGASTLNVYANMRAWLSDLSKEAERG